MIANNRRFAIVDNKTLAEGIITGRAETREMAKEVTSSEVSSRIALARSINAVGVAGEESRITSKTISGAQFSEILLLRLVLPSGVTVWAWDDTEPCDGPDARKTKCAVQDLIARLGN